MILNLIMKNLKLLQLDRERNLEISGLDTKIMAKSLIETRTCSKFNGMVVMNMNISREIVPRTLTTIRSIRGRNEALTTKDEEVLKKPKAEDNKDLYY